MNNMKETLEEAAEKLFPSCGKPLRKMAQKGFIQGAKWMQERMYSEGDMIGFAEWLFDHYNKISCYDRKELLEIYKKRNKMTAVEWLAKELYEKFEMRGDGLLYDDILKQAKEMEKQQIIDANTAGVNNGLYGYRNAEQYYNKTFKKK